ncbi:LysR substrate-binding domain-containing protein [Nocardia sp. NBC_01503]|uniref:LysR substrate-binding domain-containing protein n=1 Tax=Nocardia sp. NBC_01503 TaxID=2975997 RepID=UPI002E7C3F53|nr:LysR substrate-binding domain-containing protein [Nocardia sp. NBC_01503]WTL29737.1 LysR substrate-binding domain-containing protein [Nocardia sp. NBC_01503]
MVELRQLRYFVAVAEELHFRRAAERLFISTPTLSQQIRAIEREVGGPLLLRGSQGVELTAAGEVLLKTARGVLEAAEVALRETRMVANPERSVFRLGVVNGAPTWLPARIEALLKARQPGARVVLTGGPSADQVRLLDREDVDLAVLRMPIRLPDHLTSTAIAEEELGIVMSREHPLAAHDTIEPAQLRDQELIMFARDAAPELHDSVLAQLRERGAAVALSDSAMSHAQMLSLLPMRPAAIGVGSARTASAPGLVWRPLQPRPVVVTYVAAWRPAARNSALHTVAEALSSGIRFVP